VRRRWEGEQGFAGTDAWAMIRENWIEVVLEIGVRGEWSANEGVGPICIEMKCFNSRSVRTCSFFFLFWEPLRFYGVVNLEQAEERPKVKLLDLRNERFEFLTTDQPLFNSPIQGRSCKALLIATICFRPHLAGPFPLHLSSNSSSSLAQVFLSTLSNSFKDGHSASE